MGQFGGGERWGWGGAGVGGNFPFFLLCQFQSTILSLVPLIFPFIPVSFHLFISCGQYNARQIAGTIRTEQDEDLDRMFVKRPERQKDNKGCQCHNVYSHAIAYRLHASHEI